MSLFAFDVDETLEISGGPVKLSQLVTLRKQGHVVGICGNWHKFTQDVPNWHEIVSFIGPFGVVDWAGALFPSRKGQIGAMSHGLSKPEFLVQLKSVIRADRYVMVGNSGENQSPDRESAAVSCWEFVQEKDFVEGLEP